MEVRIVDVPPGEAPEWVRKQWVGLVLPLADGEEGARSVRTWSILKGPKTLPARLWRLCTGKYNRTHGFVVDARRAWEILADHAPDAAQWWHMHTASGQPARKLVFPAEVCQELGRSVPGTSQQFCPTCGTLFPPGDINVARGLATCRACSSTTNMDQLGPPVPGTVAPPRSVQRRRRVFPRPRHFSVREDSSSLRLRFSWIWRRFINGAFICLLWNSFLIGWYWSALRTPEKRIMWFAMIWCLPHVAVGLLLIYAMLAALLNRTVIKVTSEFFTVWHGPVPWFGNCSLRIDDLERLYCAEETRPQERRRSYVYGVHALTKGASKVELLTGLDSAQALFIKQELERWLHAHDHRVGHDARLPVVGNK
jgi:hypothetical protein